MSKLRQVCDSIWVAERNQRYYGVEVGARMTVLELADGLLVHSPIDAERDAVRALGRVRWVLAPNLLHHLYVRPWLEGDVRGWAAPGLPEKRPDLPFHAVVGSTSEPFGEEVLAIPLRSFDMTNEVVLWHRPSRTLIVTDLFFNFGPDSPWMTRAAMSFLGGYPGPGATVLEKLGMKRDIARGEIETLLALEPERIIMAHGQIIETGGTAALKHAFSWLLRA